MGDLSNAGLSGTFPQVPELSRLERLSLKHNSLKGWVPSHFANLTKLQHVDLSRNAFEQVPESIFNGQAHVCLKSLLLRHNQLRRFPAHTQHLTSLEHLDLAYNTMVDSVSDWSSEAPLVHLDVSHNSLHGPLPQLPLHALVSADFGSNQFNGSVPVGWAALRRVPARAQQDSECPAPDVPRGGELLRRAAAEPRVRDRRRARQHLRLPAAQGGVV